jgi:hypothetical protein
VPSQLTIDIFDVFQAVSRATSHFLLNGPSPLQGNAPPGLNSSVLFDGARNAEHLPLEALRQKGFNELQYM